MSFRYLNENNYSIVNDLNNLALKAFAFEKRSLSDICSLLLQIWLLIHDVHYNYRGPAYERYY